MVISASGDQQAVSLTAHRLVLMLAILEKRVDKRRDCRTRCEDYEAAQQDQAENNRQEPELFPLLHE
jgi:hypothetical protein